jgi:transposase
MENSIYQHPLKWLQNQQLEGLKNVRYCPSSLAMNWLGKSIGDTVFDYDYLIRPPKNPEVSLEATGKKELENDQSDADLSNDTKPKVVNILKLAVSQKRIKDLREEKIYQSRLNLLSASNQVFFHPTSLYFGDQGDSLDQRRYYQDHLSDLKQIVVGMAIGSDSYPICSEIWPGNTADITTLIPISETLKRRFKITND